MSYLKRYTYSKKREILDGKVIKQCTKRNRKKERKERKKERKGRRKGGSNKNQSVNIEYLSVRHLKYSNHIAFYTSMTIHIS